MGKQEEIREALAKHAGKYGPQQTMLATVQTVDFDNKMIALLDDDDLLYENVRLKPVVDDTNGLTIYPKVGTWCLAVRIESEEDWMAIAFGEIDVFRVVIGSVSLDINNTGHAIKKGNDTLKQALTLLVEAIEPIMIVYGNNPDFVKLNQAKTKINNLLR